MAGHDKTEKATPKRRETARKRGQVARSADLQGAVVLLVALLALSAFGPALAARLEETLRAFLTATATPDVVRNGGLGALLGPALASAALAVAPIALACLAAGVAASTAQVGLKPSAQALKPDPRRLDPLQGTKNLFGLNGLFEGAKAVVKVAIVGVIAALAVVPKLPELAGLVGIAPAQLGGVLTEMVLEIAKRTAIAYLAIGALDYLWQRRRHDKSLRMDKQELKDELKEHSLPPHVRAAIRRRQVQAARARMMAAVPNADVVVTNPTHYAVALAYDASKTAPEVVAKGKDLVARRIREIAAEHGVTIVSDPPLARTLHGSVEVGQVIPEELYQAVAELLAFVFRVGRRKAAAR